MCTCFVVLVIFSLRFVRLENCVPPLFAEFVYIFIPLTIIDFFSNACLSYSLKRFPPFPSVSSSPTARSVVSPDDRKIKSSKAKVLMIKIKAYLDVEARIIFLIFRFYSIIFYSILPTYLSAPSPTLFQSLLLFVYDSVFYFPCVSLSAFHCYIPPFLYTTFPVHHPSYIPLSLYTTLPTLYTTSTNINKHNPRQTSRSTS